MSPFRQRLLRELQREYDAWQMQKAIDRLFKRKGKTK